MNLLQEIIIGFPGKLGQIGDEDSDFPSLLGGEPVWFNESVCPKEVKCKLCNKDMVFLLQLYAPLETEHTYHRAIYVFFCKETSCVNKKDSVKILRTQQGRNEQLEQFKSPYFSKNILEKAYKIETDTVEVKESQTLEKEYAKISNPFEVDDKEYSKKGGKENYEKENQLLKRFTQMAMEDPDFGKELDKQMAAETWNEDEEDDDLDQSFEKYCFLLKKQGGHILRYCRNKETVPLWYSDKNQWPAQTKKCSLCGKNLIFEFQINSSVLNNFPSILEYDWGIIGVYTCENSCKSKIAVEEPCEMQILLEKDQVEQNIKNHLKNTQKYLGEEEGEEGSEDDDEEEDAQEAEEQKREEPEIKKDINKELKSNEKEVVEGENKNEEKPQAQEIQKTKGKKNKDKKKGNDKKEEKDEETKQEEEDADGTNW